MTHSNVLIIDCVNNLETCGLQHYLLLLLFLLLIGHLNQLFHIIGPELHLVYLPI